jgi:hypothetical protein
MLGARERSSGSIAQPKAEVGRVGAGAQMDHADFGQGQGAGPAHAADVAGGGLAGSVRQTSQGVRTRFGDGCRLTKRFIQFSRGSGRVKDRFSKGKSTARRRASHVLDAP